MITNINTEGDMKKKFTESTIEDFCEKQGIGPAELANLAGVHKMTINNYKSVTKAKHIVRHNEKTGEFEIVRTETVMAEGTTKPGKVKK